MDAKNQLKRYPALHHEVLMLLQRMNDLEQEEIIVDREKLDKIEQRITANIEEMELIQDKINALSDPRERVVLSLRYISGTDGKPVKWKAVTEKLYGDSQPKNQKRVIRLHRSALEHIEN